MVVRVTPHEVKIIKEETEPINEKEINVSKCLFEFDESITNEYVKEAYFTLNGNTYKQIIVNNECDYPNEVLIEKGELEIGVVVYKILDQDTYEKLYNPSPDYYEKWIGSLKDAENTEPITPTDKEQMEQAIQDMETKVDNLDIEAEKVDKTTTITITKKDGTQDQVEILDGIDGQDGKSLENMEIINRDLVVTYGGETDNLGQVAPNIQVGTTTTVTPSTNARVENVGTDLNPIFNFYIPKGEAGSIKFEIVEQLPTTGEGDTIYLVPYATVTVQELPSTGNPNTIYIVESTNKRYVYESNQWVEITSDNKYAEYIYVNGNWEQIGGISVDIDLSDYYTKSETDSLLSGKVGFTDYATNDTAGVIKSSNGLGINSSTGKVQCGIRTYEEYQTQGNSYFISKGTLENVITGKGLVSNTDYATNSVAGVLRTANGVSLSNTGAIQCSIRTYANYQTDGNNLFVSKGTLENVITGKNLETENNKVTSISSSSTDTQYPSAKCVYDIVGDIETILETLDVGSGV